MMEIGEEPHSDLLMQLSLQEEEELLKSENETTNQSPEANKSKSEKNRLKKERRKLRKMNSDSADVKNSEVDSGSSRSGPAQPGDSEAGKVQQKPEPPIKAKPAKAFKDGKIGEKPAKRKPSSPPTNPNPSKKQNTKQSYAKIASSDLTVLIRRVGASFEESEIIALRAKLCEAIDATGPGAGRPTFESNSLRSGALVFECSNSQSRDWLQNQIRVLSAENADLQLWTTTAAREKLRMKIVVTVQDSNEAPHSLIFKRFENSNSGLSTAEWVVLRNLCVSPKGRTLLIQIDPDSASFIRERGKKLYYLLQRIFVDIRGTGEKPVAKSSDSKS